MSKLCVSGDTGDDGRESGEHEHERGLGWHRRALAEARAQITELRRHAHHSTARVAALTEQNEQLRRERDGLRAQLEALQGEFHETTEEMRTAARSLGKEWRAHCDAREVAVGTLILAGVELLPGAEEAERRKLEEEESAGRAVCAVASYQRVVVAAAAAAQDKKKNTDNKAEVANTEVQLQWLYHALGSTSEELDLMFLGKSKKKGSGDWSDTNKQACGLWELYLALCDVGLPTDAAIAKLLEKEDQVHVLCFNAVGHEPDYGEFNYAIPPTANAYDFFHRLLRHLPKLNQLFFSHLPPLSSPGALEALSGAPPTLSHLHLSHTDYTVADLLTLYLRIPRLKKLGVHASCCTDWGAYAAVTEEQERKGKVNMACGGIITWRD